MPDVLEWRRGRPDWRDVLIGLLIVGFGGGAVGHSRRADRAEAVVTEGERDKAELVEQLFAAAQTIEQLEKRRHEQGCDDLYIDRLEYGCDDVAFEYIDRANILFVCQEDICEINGWTCGADCDWDRYDEGPDVNYPSKKDNRHRHTDHYPDTRPAQGFPKATEDDGEG